MPEQGVSDRKPRGLRWLKINDMLLPCFLGEGRRSYNVTKGAVPNDAQIVGVQHRGDGAVSLLLESVEWERVSPTPELDTCINGIPLGSL